MKTKIIIFLLILSGILGITTIKAFADINSDDNSKDYSKSSVYDIIKDYTYDNDICLFDVKEYSDRIDIYKQYSTHSRISYIPKNQFRDLLICNITENTTNNLNKYPIIRLSVMNDNIKNIVYDVTGAYENVNLDDLFAEGRKPELNVLFANGVYFEINESPFLDVKKIADNTYMVIYQKWDYVKYIHINKNKIVSEIYFLSHSGFPPGGVTGSKPVYPISGKILTDNIIRLEWKDSGIEHWKVRLTKDDIEKNKEYGLKQGLDDTEYNALLWWSKGIGKSPEDPKRNKIKAWNYDEDTGTEPTYK